MTDDEQRRRDLADFLRTRRERLTPEQVGLAGGGRRRTPGLRREEVAQLASVGVSWYTLLEQGRDIRPSREVLQSIAEALRLTPAERHHLLVLAGQQLPAAAAAPADEVGPALRRVLDALDPLPAYIIGRRWDYLAWNIGAEEVLLLPRGGPPPGYNAIWRIFAQTAVRDERWEVLARKVLAEFRADSAAFAHEVWFRELVADLERASPEFRAWWPMHDVRGRADARKDIEHPLVGLLQFEHTTLQVPAMPELKLMVYTPLPGTDTLEKIQLLMARRTGAVEEAELAGAPQA
jgi:transcriptional regulator with XRE-family HTH domain